MTLIELMVALVLGLILVAGVIQLFLGSRVTYTSGEALARVQENGRFALEMFKPALRDTGAVSFCGGQIPVNNRLRTSCPNAAAELFNHPMLGWEYAGTGPDDEFTIETTEPDGNNNAWSNNSGLALPSELENRVVPGTDVIHLRSLLLCEGLTASNDGNQLGFPDPGSLPPAARECVKQGDITMVTDCATGADLFQNTADDNSGNLAAGGAANCNPGPGNTPFGSNPWSTNYDDNAQIYRVVPQAFYIGYSDNSGGDCAQTALNGECGEPGLWRVNYSRGYSNARHEELVRGVENMQILYGLSNPAPAGDGRSVDQWLTANNIALTDWPRVIAMHVALIVRSPENADTALTVREFELGALGTLDPVTIDHAGDRRLRHTFESTVAVRNQMRR